MTAGTGGYQVTEALETAPGSAGGMIESVKRAVMLGLRNMLTGTGMTTEESTVHVDMEYPVERTNYPGIWVQFSTTEMRPSGMAHMMRTEAGDFVKQWYFEGRVSMLVVALTSLERDRIADCLIQEFAFPDLEHDTLGCRSPLYAALESSPYVAITVNSDALRAGGQQVTVGTPWDPDQLAYEDTYSFDIIGEFQQVRDPAGLVELRRVDAIATADYGGGRIDTVTIVGDEDGGGWV